MIGAETLVDRAGPGAVLTFASSLEIDLGRGARLHMDVDTPLCSNHFRQMGSGCDRAVASGTILDSGRYEADERADHVVRLLAERDIATELAAASNEPTV